jgi:hypothetical protein
MFKQSSNLLKSSHATTILIVLMVVATEPLASPVESEVDVLGVIGTVDVAYGDHTTNSAISAGSELDVYRFSGTAGDSVSVAVAGSTGGFDPRIEVRDGSGALINDQSCDSYYSSSLCSVTALTTLPNTGTYTATISDAGLDNAGSYTMHIDQYPPVSNWLEVAYDTPMSEQLGHLADFDAYAFNAATGSLVRLTLQGTTGGLDMLLEAFSPQGDTLDSASCDSYYSSSTCSASVDLSITDTGLHSFLIADVGDNNTGNYNFSVTCLSASCESPIPPPTPTTPIDLSGTVQTGDGTGLCAMVLASGQFMFSCDPDGPFSLTNLSRENDGTVKRQIYVDGFFPQIDILEDSGSETVVMDPAGICPSYNPSADPGVFPDSAGKRIKISGEVLLQDTNTPLCAMVLANGQYMFSCDGTGSYALNIPLDMNGQFKLQVYADGFAPTIQTFDEFQAANDVRMARAVECQ